MNNLALNQTDLARLYASGVLIRPKLAVPEKPRKEYTFKPETLAKMAAARAGKPDKLQRDRDRRRLYRQRNLARGLTTQGTPRKQLPPKNRNAINALRAGLVPYLTYEDRNGRTVLYMAAKRMGVRLLFNGGKCTINHGEPVKRDYKLNPGKFIEEQKRLDHVRYEARLAKNRARSRADYQDPIYHEQILERQRSYYRNKSRLDNTANIAHTRAEG